MPEKGVWDSEEKFKVIFDSIHDAIVCVDTRGRITDVNKRVEEMLGYRRGELLGKHFARLGILKLKDVPKFLKLFKDSIKKGKVEGRVNELELKCKDGSSIIVEVSTRIIKKNEKVEGMVNVIRDVTERKRVEEEIREAREHAENIVNTIHEALIVLDDELKVISANRSFYRMFRVTPKETVGRFIYDLGNRQWDIPELRRLLEGIIPKHTKLENFEVEHDFPKIGRKTMLLNARRLEGERKPEMILLAIQDITEQKEMERELRESEEQYRNLVDNAIVGIYRTNLKGEILYANRALAEMFGFESPKEMMKEGVLARYKNPEDRKVLIESLRKKGKVRNFELELLTKTGETKNIILSASLEGDVISGMIMDITELKKAHEELHKTMSMFESVIENAPMVAIQGFDRNGVIYHWNFAATQVYGYRKEEVIGKRLQNLLLTKEGAKEFERVLKKIWDTGKPSPPREWLVLTKERKEKWVYSTMFPIFEGDKVVEVFCMDVDITERKRMEEELKSRTEELERFMKLSVGRELKMVELKKRIKELERRLREVGVREDSNSEE